MRRILKWFGIGFAGLIGVLIVVATALYVLAGPKINETYDITVASVTVPTDAASVERGRHQVESLLLCADCHGEDLSGEVDADPLFGVFAPRNLTPGVGGLDDSFTDADYVRAIRHGVGKDGKAIVLMPSEIYTDMSDADLGSLIAYLKALPPVDNEQPRSTLRVLGRIFAAFDTDSFFAARVIDHDAARPAEPEPGATREYGAYLTFMCSACHGENLSGGEVLGFEPGAPLAPNLTPGGELGSWTEEEFFTTIRTGQTPAGRNLENDFMPWVNFRKMTDEELRAIWLYLESLAPREFRE
jgi:mono/diheme cytochrome c family protein